MGRVVVSQFVTVDGVFEDPGGSEGTERGGWAFQFERGEDGDKFNGMTKYVVSSTLGEPQWSNSKLISSDVPGEVERLRETDGGDILVNGSGRLVDTLVEHDLVDEYRLMVFPTVLGSGKRLFGDLGAPKALRLVESRPVGTDGVVILIFQPVTRAD